MDTPTPAAAPPPTPTMTRLTRAKKLTRIGVVILGIGIVSVSLLRAGVGYIDYLTVQQRAKLNQNIPNVALGRLETLKIQPTDITTATASLTLDLVGGNLPQATTSAAVYRTGEPSLSLSAQDRARTRAKQLSFTTEPAQPNPSTFAWSTPDGRQLNVNLQTQDFTLGTTLPISALTDRLTFNAIGANRTTAAGYLRGLLGYADLEYTNPVAQFVRPTEFGFASSGEDTQTPTDFIRFSFRRTDLDKLPVYSPNGPIGQTTLVIVPQKRDARQNTQQGLQLDQIAALSSAYYPINATASGRYPIITSKDAYAKLEQNIDEYLVWVEPNTGAVAPTSFITGRVLFARLAYLEPDTSNTTTVQPVWMFEGRASTNAGDSRWTAYVPAVDYAKIPGLIEQNRKLPKPTPTPKNSFF